MTQIVIQYDERTGQLQVKGPVHNKVLFYGILEAAKDAVREAPKGPQVIPAQTIPRVNGQ